MIASREYVKDLLLKVLKSTGFKKESNKYINGESIVGQWIDGKSIYRKVVTCTNISAAGDIYCPSGVSNIERIIDTRILITGDNFSVVCSSSGSAYNTTTGKFSIDGVTYFKNTAAINPNNFRINISSNGITDLKTKEIAIIFDYTKTTD